MYKSANGSKRVLQSLQGLWIPEKGFLSFRKETGTQRVVHWVMRGVRPGTDVPEVSEELRRKEAAGPKVARQRELARALSICEGPGFAGERG